MRGLTDEEAELLTSFDLPLECDGEYEIFTPREDLIASSLATRGLAVEIAHPFSAPDTTFDITAEGRLALRIHAFMKQAVAA